VILELLRACIASFLGTFGFCALLQVPKKAVFPASTIGVLAYLTYWIAVRVGLPDDISTFIGALVGSLAAQMLARRMHMISTIFVLLSIVPAVPGLGIYQFMEKLGSGEYSDGAAVGVEAMITVLGIALGIAAGSVIFRAIFTARAKR